MDIEIIKVNSKEMAEVANSLLTKLIHYEKQYNENINDNFIVDSYYDSFYMNDDVCILLAKCEDKYVGYIYATMIDNGNTCIKPQVKFDALFIDENYRNNKVGQKLIDEGIKWAKSKGVKYIELTVCNDNLKAIEFYKNNDFKIKKLTMECELEE